MNFAVQGLTVVVITIVLLFLNLKLALITLLAVVPITVVLSEWFRRKSSNAYRIVRNKISDVLSDLQESLAGIRVITCLLYTSPSPRDATLSRMPSSA